MRARRDQSPIASCRARRCAKQRALRRPIVNRHLFLSRCDQCGPAFAARRRHFDIDARFFPGAP
jgi:hypothetical protein